MCNEIFPFSEYVQLYIDFLLNKSIQKQFAAFYHGFHRVCSSDALMVSPRCVCVRACVLTYIFYCIRQLQPDPDVQESGVNCV